MKQTSLLSFFNNKNLTPLTSNKINENDTLHTYFYLHWIDKKPKAHAQFLKDKPKLINFKHNFIWNNIEMTLCGYFDFLIYDDEPYKSEKEKKYKNICFLKSLLQKAIRRKNVDVAVKCAYHYCLLDLQDFLRRLPIIIIEDTILHEVYPTLIWLMIASTLVPKEYKVAATLKEESSTLKESTFFFDKVIYEYLMGIVYVIAQSPYYHDISSSANSLESNISKNELTNFLITQNKKDKSLKSLIYSLLLRKAYGGMKCDLEMLERYAYVWSTLEYDSKYLNKMNIRPIMLESISLLQLNEWIVEAIDFHCAPQILTYINEEYPEYNEDYIKKLIWHYSSKINMRIKENVIEDKEIDKNDWNNIKKYVKRVQYYLLEENY